MSGLDLRAGLERYGADFARWPQPLRGEAGLALDNDPEFARAHSQAKAFDAALHQALAVPPVPLGYAARIAARAMDAGRRDQRALRARLAVLVGGGWMAAASIAGVAAANLLAWQDSGLIQLAGLALGSTSVVTGN